ncbi:MAG: hypothetical protein QNJ97_15470 [Myxococcota bacterium]|nr:hypothetical protein [Myxococcota bacterium]
MKKSMDKIWFLSLIALITCIILAMGCQFDVDAGYEKLNLLVSEDQKICEVTALESGIEREKVGSDRLGDIVGFCEDRSIFRMGHFIGDNASRWLARYSADGSRLLWQSRNICPNDRNCDGDYRVQILRDCSVVVTQVHHIPDEMDDALNIDKRSDVALMKLNPDGVLLWSIRSISNGYHGLGQFLAPKARIEVDNETGRIIVASTFFKETILDEGGANETALTTGEDGKMGMYLATFDSEGTLLWARQIENPFEPQAIEMISDQKLVLLGGEPVKTREYSHVNLQMGIFSSSGDTIERKNIGQSCIDENCGVEAAEILPLEDGSFIIAGRFFIEMLLKDGLGHSVTFSGGPQGSEDNTSCWVLASAFLARFSSAGELLWAQAPEIADEESGATIGIRTENSVFVRTLVEDANGGVILFGSMVGRIVLGSGTEKATQIVSRAREEGESIESYLREKRGFVAHYSLDGTLDWARHLQLGPVELLRPLGLSILEDGRLLAVASFSSGRLEVTLEDGGIATIDPPEASGVSDRYFTLDLCSI